MSVQPHDEPACTPTSEPSVELEIHPRARDLGDFVVARLLPTALRRSVGPFLFWDHFGPVKLPPGRGMDVRPHPHINLATVTYLFEGEIIHRDSLGSEQPIRPGAINWMMAGSGIVHSERSPDSARLVGPPLHGLQLWVGLPTAHEEDAPSFQHHAADSLPWAEQKGARLRILAGSAYGQNAPVSVLSPLFYVAAELDAGAELALPDFAERGAYVLRGAVECDKKTHPAGMMLVFRAGKDVCLRAREPSLVMLFGGAPLGERHMFWNFVSSSKERIERAKEDWRLRRFATVPGDEVEFIPLP
jgi:redox-sensitive bicupin YhaK (pirin superfamily)